MKTIYHQLYPFMPLVLCAALSLAGCGANTDASGDITTAAKTAPSSGAPDQKQSETSPKRGVATAFIPALGSQGNGVAMMELKNHGGQLREPDANYDVYDTSSTADLKTLAQNIQVSLDRDRRVLIDSDGTPESREKAARISYEAIGASLPDIGSVLIRKAPEEQGGGYLLIPIYTRTDVAEQIAQGKINKTEDLNNSIDSFFFEPKEVDLLGK